MSTDQVHGYTNGQVEVARERVAWPWEEAVLADRRCAQAAVRRLQAGPHSTS